MDVDRFDMEGGPVVMEAMVNFLSWYLNRDCD